MTHTIPRLAARPARPCRPLTPRQRADVRQALARAIGAGRPVSREAVVAELFGATPDATVTPTVTPGAGPDDVVTVADAAARLSLSVATVRRYCAPSSGKLARLGDGVSLASVEALAATR